VKWRLRDVLERNLERIWYGPKDARYLLALLTLGLLTPFFRIAARRRRRVRAAPAPLPLIGVGNLVVGGSGKTPVALELARRVTLGGAVPALLLRGYGARRRGEPMRVRGTTPLELAGDEARLLALKLPQALVLVGADRLASARLASQLGASLAVLDDGLQQRRVAVDRRVWVIAAESPFGNGQLLPLGPLRDPLEVIAPEDVIWVHGRGSAPQSMRADIITRNRPVGFASAFDLEDLRPATPGMRVAAFCGIARSLRFLDSLRELGVEVVRAWPRGDHRVFGADELMDAARLAQTAGAIALVCTEKDAVRLPAISTPLPILALRLELEIERGNASIDALLGG
jgi:tetraacyldisaccharide 4'-kinase